MPSRAPAGAGGAFVGWGCMCVVAFVATATVPWRLGRGRPLTLLASPLAGIFNVRRRASRGRLFRCGAGGSGRRSPFVLLCGRWFVCVGCALWRFAGVVCSLCRVLVWLWLGGGIGLPAFGGLRLCGALCVLVCAAWVWRFRLRWFGQLSSGARAWTFGGRCVLLRDPGLGSVRSPLGCCVGALGLVRGAFCAVGVSVFGWGALGRLLRWLACCCFGAFCLGVLRAPRRRAVGAGAGWRRRDALAGGARVGATVLSLFVLAAAVAGGWPCPGRRAIGRGPFGAGPSLSRPALRAGGGAASA